MHIWANRNSNLEKVFISPSKKSNIAFASTIHLKGCCSMLEKLWLILEVRGSLVNAEVTLVISGGIIHVHVDSWAIFVLRARHVPSPDSPSLFNHHFRGSRVLGGKIVNSFVINVYSKQFSYF